MPFADLTTGARLHYEDDGSGFPLIALHGRFGTARTEFPQMLDWLSESYRVLGPSLRGYGQSTPKPRDYPLDFYQRDARDVIAFMDALEIERAHLLGFSDGGETALVAAGLAPERFRSVAVWGAVGYFGPEIRPVVQANYPATWMDEATKQLHDIADPNPIVLQWVQALKFMIDSGGDVSLSLAPNISAPVLLMLGDRDRLNPEAYGQKWVDRARNARLVMFKTAHAVHEEDWDGFRRVVGDFLKAADAKLNDTL
ncbi:MAG: alpha/beta hydrolase [Anaerolineae bacterium]